MTKELSYDHINGRIRVEPSLASAVSADIDTLQALESFARSISSGFGEDKRAEFWEVADSALNRYAGFLARLRQGHGHYHYYFGESVLERTIKHAETSTAISTMAVKITLQQIQ